MPFFTLLCPWLSDVIGLISAGPPCVEMCDCVLHDLSQDIHPPAVPRPAAGLEIVSMLVYDGRCLH